MFKCILFDVEAFIKDAGDMCDQHSFNKESFQRGLNIYKEKIIPSSPDVKRAHLYRLSVEEDTGSLLPQYLYGASSAVRNRRSELNDNIRMGASDPAMTIFDIYSKIATSNKKITMRVILIPFEDMDLLKLASLDAAECAKENIINTATELLQIRNKRYMEIEQKYNLKRQDVMDLGVFISAGFLFGSDRIKDGGCRLCGDEFSSKEKMTRHVKDIHKLKLTETTNIDFILNTAMCRVWGDYFPMESKAKRHAKSKRCKEIKGIY